MGSTGLAADFSFIVGIVGLLLSIPAWAIFLRGVATLVRFVRAGKPLPERTSRPVRRAAEVLKQVVGHTQLARKPLVAVAHWCVMVGFLLGFVLWFEAYIQTFNPAGGWPWISTQPWYHLCDELLGIGTVVGIITLIIIRQTAAGKQRLSRFYGSNARAAYFVEAVVFIEGAGMLLVKAAKIATYPNYQPHLATDFVTMQLAKLLPASPELVSVFALIKLLSGLVWLAIVGRQLTWGVAWHRFTAFFTIFFRTHADGRKALGALAPLVDDSGKPIHFDELEDSPATLGTGFITDASWKMLLDTTACTECGRCQELCPAWNTGKPLSPKKVITDLRDGAMGTFPAWIDPSALEYDDSHAGVDVLKLAGEGGAITQDVLFSCTNCGACVEQCPVDIEHLDHVTNLRRYSVLVESDFPSELTGMFTNLERKANPWGRAAKERRTWVDKAREQGLEVPIFGEDVTDFSDCEYLFWVGCAGAFDEQGQKTTMAIVECLHVAGVKFAVLGDGERCTGDPARRAGNELLFQMLANDNIATLNDVFDGVARGGRKIITSCPHCFNTLRNEYPEFDGNYDVFHHTQLLNRLVRDKRLVPIPRTPDQRKPVTFHDPCFLGRHNKVFDPPRELVEATGASLTEMPRNKNTGFCCGAGGARMFMEEHLGTRIADARAAEAIDTGAATVAVGCPFCHVMLSSGVKAQHAVDSATGDPQSAAPNVADVAVMLRDAISTDGRLPEALPKAFVDPARTQLSIVPKRNTDPVTDPTLPERSGQTANQTGQAAVSQQPEAQPVESQPVAPRQSPQDLAPGAAIPGSAQPPAPGSVPPRPGTATPPPPGGVSTPRPGGTPATAGLPGAPGGVTPPAPGGALAGNAAPQTASAGGNTPMPAGGGIAPLAPGGARPTPGSGAPTEATTVTPAQPSAPGSARPAPGAAQPAVSSVAQPVTPGGVTPPTPGRAQPTPPGSAAPKPPGGVQPSSPSGTPVLAPGGVRPSAPGGATPPAPGGVSPVASSASQPVTPGKATPVAPGKAAPVVPGNAAPVAPLAPGKAAPVTPGTAKPKAPGGTRPLAPGGARPMVSHDDAGSDTAQPKKTVENQED
ncbi:succinate dehydrogenase/fumarate reductase iron-sulfur subunit [Corynebacterium choanae]|uniref:Succinate dehydrogenase/fumarate reductase iron-sulfur subunit n=1 Tax=Corynebacterium choanae TaxID=1862358 RepID=A0A3G6J4H3_9CORY|nr:(Fe-S)-binding protein [Corynebacterium choanae]AZA12623.1 succinate dehydrogenase/fumarate reductase iron-sulfur subunit [Corynebacterium choanae]